jgi:hypothetical protein
MTIAEKILMLVEEETGITIKKMSVRHRYKDVVLARFIAFYLLHKFTPTTLKSIGRMIAPDKPFDHTSVIHGIEVIINAYDKDMDLRRKIDRIAAKVITGEEDIPKSRRSVAVIQKQYDKLFDAYISIKRQNRDLKEKLELLTGTPIQ